MTWKPFRYDMVRDGALTAIDASPLAMKLSAGLLRLERLRGKSQ